MIDVQRATESDWRRVQAVRFKALLDAPDAFATTIEESRQRSGENWRTRLSAKESATFIASFETEDVGMAVGAPYDDDVGLFAMWVDAQARGRGVGDALVAAVIEWATSREHQRLFLDVGDTNFAAISLYVRNGFLRTGVTGALDPPRSHVTEHQRCLDLRSLGSN